MDFFAIQNSPQDELPNNWLDDDQLDESEPWYGNDTDLAETGYFGNPSGSPASMTTTESMAESESWFNADERENRKRKRDGEESGEM